MSNEPASGEPPIATNEPAKKSAPEVEYDDFGLPVRKRGPRSPVLDSSASKKEDEGFKDAVGTRSASKEDVPSQATKNDENGSSSANGPAEESKAKEAEGAEHREAAHRPQNATVSEYSHQQLAPETRKEPEKTVDNDDGEWQAMPAYARWDMYDDDNRLIAKENSAELEDMSGYENVGGAAKGYTRVIMDDDVESVTSMDENTAYLFKQKETAELEEYGEEDEAARDPLAQMQTTKNILTEGQRIAYVGLVRLAMVEMENRTSNLEKTKKTKKIVERSQETTKMWSQKMAVRLYTHMDVDAAEQIMIEQLKEHGVIAADLTPTLMQNARVKNPAAAEEPDSAKASTYSPRPESRAEKSPSSSSLDLGDAAESPPPPPYQEHDGDDLPAVRTPSQLPQTKDLDIDLRWTILCDLFLVLIADSVYDARSRQLLECVGKYLGVDWLDICRFEKRVTDALEMQEEASKENWNEDEHMKDRQKRARNKRLALMGLATVGGSLVIGLSAGLLAPVIGAGIAAGITTIGLGSGTFFAGVGGAAVITTTGVLSGGTIGVRAANRRLGPVKTFEYRPLHNNKRVNLIVTISGWMNGKVDDVRLPYSTVDPIMGDIYSILWEPEMLRSMGDTINILATEALTQGLQQVLGNTILMSLMMALQLPVALTKLSYLIDNPWSVSQARADMAGLILADSLIARNLGSRPITLVGFSLGARVIHSCLSELAKRGAFGIVQNAYMFGTPVVAKKDKYTKLRAIVPGRLVNGYAKNDWILGYLFRATSGGIMQVAGLAAVDVPGVENIDVTELVPGHMAYRAAMPKLLREVGWMVESDEFSEIEDPDPENHEQRQRELINEIEEARKELEQKPEKKGFAFWRKKKTSKKDWEVYDEHSQQKAFEDQEGQDPAADMENPVMFDIDAMRAEIAALSAEGIEVKEIKSTLPPMKIDITATPPNPYSSLRETKSYNDSPVYHRPSPSQPGGSGPSRNIFQEYEEHDDGGMTMTFDNSFHNTPSISPPHSRSPLPSYTSPEIAQSSWDTPASTSTADRPAFKSPTIEPHVPLAAPNYNAWADDYDDHDFGKEKEMKMTFE